MEIKKRLLVVIDPEDGGNQSVLLRAVQLAKALDAHVELFLSCTEYQFQNGALHSASVSDGERKKQVARYEGLLTKECETLRAQSLSCSWLLNLSTSMIEAVLDRVEQCRPMFVLKESQIHTRIVRSLFYRTDWDLIKRCPAPLWLVRGSHCSPESAFVACIDPLHHADKAATIDREILNLTKGLAEKLNVGMKVCHVLVPLTGCAKPFVISSLVRSVHDEPASLLLKFLADFEISEEQLHMQEGYPEVVLSELIASLDGAVVVIGALARRGIGAFLLGGTAQRVLDRVNCDVLVVKPQRASPDSHGNDEG